MNFSQELKQRIINGYEINKEDALKLAEQPLNELCVSANELREHYCKNAFDICTIINGKSGRCSENCKYCAQSSHFKTTVEEYPLLHTNEIVTQAHYNQDRGILRYSVVTSGKNLSDEEIDQICESYQAIQKECDISLCASHGLLSYEQFKKLKASGVTRYHNNLETSRRNFSTICTTHIYDDKMRAIKDAQKAGLEICSGGIMGLGETMEDRIDMILDIRSLGIKSVPVNILNPIKGTPYENVLKLSEDEVCRIVALFRFILPYGTIRLAGGRGLLSDKGKCAFQSGANATISGDMLTTSGISIQEDMQMIKELGFETKKL